MSTDWSSLSTYYDVVTALRERASANQQVQPEEFITGPLLRLFELARDDHQNVRVRARTLEFARHWVEKVEKLAGSRAAVASFRTKVHEQLMRCFGPAGGSFSWAIDVFEGRRSHNG